jgi:hypothetical protein
MTEPHVAYFAPGADHWTLVVADGRIIALGGEVDGPTLESLWAAARERRELAAILDLLTARGVSSAPTFALLGWDRPKARSGVTVDAVVRGAIPVAIETATGKELLSADGVASWLEKRVVGVQRLVVGESCDAPGLPMETGVVLAAGCSLSFDGSVAKGQTSPTAAVEPPEDAPSVTSSPAVSSARPTAEAPSTGDETMVAPPEGIAFDDARPTTEESTDESSGAADQAESGYGHLFEATIARPIHAAAVRNPDQDGLIGAPPVEEDAPEGVRESDPVGDHDFHTQVVTDMAALRAARRSARPEASAPEPAGPTLFLESSDGAREPLDRPLLLGRAPSATRVSGANVPRLLTVVTPNQELSRTHAEVRVEGGTVVVTDLHSKNGTLVTLPGKTPQKLREGEPTAVITGAVIDLGDGAVFVVGEA